jgi:hypothetical protein
MILVMSLAYPPAPLPAELVLPKATLARLDVDDDDDDDDDDDEEEEEDVDDEDEE